MNAIKYLVIFGVILAIVGIFLPKEYEVTRELGMQAPEKAIQTHVSNMDNWSKWAVWEETTPPAGIRPGQMQSGVGSGRYFTGNAGSGWFVITEDSTVDGFEYVIYSDSGDKSKANITYTDMGAKIKVRWVIAGSVTKPPVIAPYITLSKGFFVGSTMNQSLKNLKKLVEQEYR